MSNEDNKQFTPEQIEEFCEKASNICLNDYGLFEAIRTSVQIIKQLQEELVCLNLQK